MRFFCRKVLCLNKFAVLLHSVLAHTATVQCVRMQKYLFL